MLEVLGDHIFLFSQLKRIFYSKLVFFGCALISRLPSGISPSFLIVETRTTSGILFVHGYYFLFI